MCNGNIHLSYFGLFPNNNNRYRPPCPVSSHHHSVHHGTSWTTCIRRYGTCTALVYHRYSTTTNSSMGTPSRRVLQYLVQSPMFPLIVVVVLLHTRNSRLDQPRIFLVQDLCRCFSGMRMGTNQTTIQKFRLTVHRF